jgi:hypothetical protein
MHLADLFRDRELKSIFGKHARHQKAANFELDGHTAVLEQE